VSRRPSDVDYVFALFSQVPLEENL